MSRILLADDDELYRKMLRKTLERMGHFVIEARNGDEALRACRLETPDLVLTDLVMPEKDGLETIQEIRMEFPLLPIIAMSGGAGNRSNLYLSIANRFGAECILAKPFSNQTLAEAVGAALA